MDQHLAALVAAAREAMVNAAKHAGVEEVSVYAEVEDGTASVFVRDRGGGFDPAEVGADRRGLAIDPPADRATRRHRDRPLPARRGRRGGVGRDGRAPPVPRPGPVEAPAAPKSHEGP